MDEMLANHPLDLDGARLGGLHRALAVVGAARVPFDRETDGRLALLHEHLVHQPERCRQLAAHLFDVRLVEHHLRRALPKLDRAHERDLAPPEVEAHE